MLPTIIPETLPSFDGRTIEQNIQRADAALARMSVMSRVHNRNNSQWMNKHLTFSWPSLTHQAKQVAAESARLQQALAEAKYNLRKKQAECRVKEAEIGEKEEELGREVSPASRARIEAEIGLLQVDLERIVESVSLGVTYIEGALKDVLTIERMYDELVARNGGKPFTERQHEEEEQRSQLKRAFQQALREMRAHGVILPGNMEYLQQCGVNPSAARKDCADFLSLEISGKFGLDIAAEYEFLNAVAEKYYNCGEVALRLHGFATAIRDDALFNGDET